MYGLIGKITSVSGQRDALAGILIAGTASSSSTEGGL
jgi:hypothetical protein